MRVFRTILFLLIAQLTFGQSLPIDFESDISTSDFIDFDGGLASVIPNPQISGINMSMRVGQIVRDGGQIWAGSKLTLSESLDFSTMNAITMKVFTTAPAGTTVKFKLEGNGSSVERDVQTKTSNEWETLTWDFTGVPPSFNEIVFMFDFGNVGNGSINSTFLFDDIERLFGGLQIDFPVDFEDDNINYTMSDFGGNVSELVTDPTDMNNRVIKVIKTDLAATWAGTTIGTPAGFATDIPLSLTDSKMTVRVWSPEAGTPIRLKVEDSDDPTHTCETEINTTAAGEWETMEFDFNNQAPGTESLSVGLSMGWTYNMASIFFNFGAEGPDVGEKTYYFDDVRFGDITLNAENFNTLKNIRAYPNPGVDHWVFETQEEQIISLEIYDDNNKLVQKLNPKNKKAEVSISNFTTGLYYVLVKTKQGVGIRKVFKR